ncbi:NSs protein [Pongola virus - SAAr1]|uniref:Non-structural protein NS-S n=2 Tax=Orthobunyavirus bwambaense TaxID=3052384 RepID=B3U4Y1_9VIRU|nr:NSs protein [Pongola virus - SAAr1]AIN37037.1 nonstructural protein NSs [Pongola virus - SAAr1]UZT55186.1 NSs protein [Pongola virus]UZT55189.1 NSs protein [Pongola virus]UZT55193.1 NSs protein [Pongola virus]
MMSTPSIPMRLILMQDMWHFQTTIQGRLISLQLGHFSSMPQRPRVSSVINLTRRLNLNLETGRWRLSIIIFLETGTIQLVKTILPSTGFQDI